MPSHWGMKYFCCDLYVRFDIKSVQLLLMRTPHIAHFCVWVCVFESMFVHMKGEDAGVICLASLFMELSPSCPLMRVLGP